MGCCPARVNGEEREIGGGMCDDDAAPARARARPAGQPPAGAAGHDRPRRAGRVHAGQRAQCPTHRPCVHDVARHPLPQCRPARGPHHGDARARLGVRGRGQRPLAARAGGPTAMTSPGSPSTTGAGAGCSSVDVFLRARRATQRRPVGPRTSAARRCPRQRQHQQPGRRSGQPGRPRCPQGIAAHPRNQRGQGSGYGQLQDPDEGRSRLNSSGRIAGRVRDSTSSPSRRDPMPGARCCCRCPTTRPRAIVRPGSTQFGTGSAPTYGRGRPPARASPASSMSPSRPGAGTR